MTINIIDDREEYSKKHSIKPGHLQYQGTAPMPPWCVLCGQAMFSGREMWNLGNILRGRGVTTRGCSSSPTFHILFTTF